MTHRHREKGTSGSCSSTSKSSSSIRERLPLPRTNHNDPPNQRIAASTTLSWDQSQRMNQSQATGSLRPYPILSNHASMPSNAPHPLIAKASAALRKAQLQYSGSTTAKKNDQDVAVSSRNPVQGGMVQPKAWVTVPVSDPQEKLRFRPRGFSADGSGRDTESNWDIKHKYLIAHRTGPTEVPDHIIAKHSGFPKKSRGEFTSPYSIFYFDETAPNNILLENDVLHREKTKHTSLLHAVDDKGEPVKGALRPKRHVSAGSSRSTADTNGSVGSNARGGKHARSSYPNDPQYKVVERKPNKVAAGGGSLHQTASDSVSTHYASVERAGCCGAREEVSYYGDRRSYGADRSWSGRHSATGLNAKFENAAALDYVPGRITSEGLRSDLSTATSGTRLKFDKDSSTHYVETRSVFSPSSEVPPTYPIGDSPFSQARPRQRRVCCGMRRDHSSRTTTTSRSSRDNSSCFTFASSSYTSSPSHTSSSSSGGYTETSSATSSSATSSSALHRSSATHATRTNVAQIGQNFGATSSCSSFGAPLSRSGQASEQQTIRRIERGVASTIPPTQGATFGGGHAASVAPSASAYTSKGRDCETKGSYSSSSSGWRQQLPSSQQDSSVTHFLLQPDRGLEEESREVATGWDRHLPPVFPTKKSEAQKEFRFNVRKMFFDVDGLRIPDNGTGTKMLPGYSVSYRNFPVIAYDVIAPKDYQDFFRIRRAPGMYE